MEDEAPYYFVYGSQGDVRGPIGRDELVELYWQGVVVDATPVWRQGDSAWSEFGNVAELASAAAEQRPAKRTRHAARAPQRAELPLEFEAWLEELDQESLEQVFRRALLRYRPYVVEGIPEARDALLSSFVQRFPGCDDTNPANYQFSDDFLCDAVDDVPQEALWELMGEGNPQAVAAVVRSAAQLDERFLGRLYAFWATGRARKLVVAGDSEGLLHLLQDDKGLVMTRDMHGRTVLHYLAEAGDGELLAGVLEALPAMASQRDAVDENLDSPCHLAARVGAAAAVAVLLRAGANPNLQNRDTSEYASGNWSVKSRDLEFKVPVPSQHQTPLHIAAEQADLPTMRLLIDAGARLDLRDSAGSTPLVLALFEAQDGEAARLLLSAGANPNLANNDMGEHSTPLHQCCSSGHAQLVEALLATGRVDVNKPDSAGWTPLHLAVRRGSLPCVRLLLQHGADVGTRTQQGKTPLDIALVNKREQIAGVLRQVRAHAAAAADQA